MAFRFAVVTVISDGVTARYGTPFTPFEHYAPWNVDDDGNRSRRSLPTTMTSASNSNGSSTASSIPNGSCSCNTTS